MTHDKSTITIDGNIIRGTKCVYNIELTTYFKLNDKELASIIKATHKKLDAILIKKEIKQLDRMLRNHEEKEPLPLACLSEVVC